MLAFRTALFFLLGLFFFLKTDRVQTPDPKWADTLLAQKLIQQARQLNRNDAHQAALEKAQQAYALYKRWYGDQDLQTAKARGYVAREYRNLDREAEALELFHQSLSAFETAGDTFRIATCHLNIGLCLRELYRYAEAHREMQAGLALLRPDSARQATVLADFYVGIGSVFNAEKNYLAAIPVLENTKTVYTEYQVPEALGMTSYHLGGAWFGLHDYARAKENYLTALANLKNVIKPGHSYFADLYVKIGTCCLKTGEPDRGLQYLLEARDAYLKAGGEDLNYIQFLKYLGEFYLDAQRYPEAVEQLERCLKYQEKTFGNDDIHLLSVLQVLGEASIRAGKYGQAESCCRRALDIASRAPAENRAFRYRLYTQLAEIQLQRADIPGCLLRCDTAFAIAGFNPNLPGAKSPSGDYFRDLCQLYARALSGKFEQTRQLPFLLQAEQYFARAAAILYQNIEAITVSRSREIFYDRDHLLLEQWLDARMRLYAITGKPEHAEAAFQIASRSKAFLLSKAMRQSGALRYAGVPDSMLQQERNLRELIIAAEKAEEQSRLKNDAPTDDAVLQRNRELTRWRKEYDSLLRYMERNYPQYYQLQRLPPDIPSATLRRKTLGPDQALLLYSLTDTRPYAFLLTRDTFCALALAPAAGLGDQVVQFRKCLTEYHSNPEAGDALYDHNLDRCLTLSQQLYQALVQPFAQLLPKRIILIPDGKLWYLPFEALLSAAPADAGNFHSYPFWGREKALSYCLSPDFLVKRRRVTSVAPKPWLGLAPFSKAINSRDTRALFASLPYSGAEVQTIAGLVKGESWLGMAAAPGRFQQEGARYRILHLATHCKADDRQGDYTYLALSASGNPTPAKDLCQFSLAAEMVVLSACEAGSGQLLRGEGLVGMVRAFTYAGAHSVVASLWLANDESTANLMIDFYRNLRQGMPKDQALQAARVHLFQQFPAQAHPFYWAGFRVYGDLAPLW